MNSRMYQGEWQKAKRKVACMTKQTERMHGEAGSKMHGKADSEMHGKQIAKCMGKQIAKCTGKRIVKCTGKQIDNHYTYNLSHVT